MPSDESNEERESRRDDLSYQQGKRDAKVDGRLGSVEQRVAAINGSIDRTGNRLEKVEHKLDRILARLDSDDAVDADRTRELERANTATEKANEKQISTRMFWVGVAAVCATLIASQLAQAHLFGAILIGGLL